MTETSRTVETRENGFASMEPANSEFVPGSRTPIKAAILTGCQDRPYAFGLARALVAKGVRVEVIGGDEIDSPEMHLDPNLHFLNLRGKQDQNAKFAKKLFDLSAYYARLIRYTTRNEPRIFHILWNNKFEYFDRVLLMLFYKLQGKKIALTAHNINQARRDSNDSLLNRLTLRVQYRLTDHIFVHTQKMKNELVEEFGASNRNVTVLRHPINDAFPDTDLTPCEAKRLLGLRNHEKAVLFLGRIRPYKGIELLLEAFKQLVARDSDYRLILAGEPKKGSEDYLAEIQRQIRERFNPEQIIVKIQFIPDVEMEVYLKAADVMVLPYKEIFQSGVLFLGYSFGLPVVATDVGSFTEEIVEGKTGFLCEPGSPNELAKAIERYFQSELFKGLKFNRRKIRDYANEQHSWGAVAELTLRAYSEMLGRITS